MTCSSRPPSVGHADEGDRELVELLRRRGAPVHEVDTEPWVTPIAWAGRMNHGAILALLEFNS